MRFLLDYFRRIPIESPEIIEAYAVIDAYSKKQGISMGKNDLWIAAAAHVTGFELLTTDADFDHLHTVFFSRTFVPHLTAPKDTDLPEPEDGSTEAI